MTILNKKMVKKYLAVLCASAVSLAFMVTVVRADITVPQGSVIQNPIAATSIEAFVTKVLDLVVQFGAILSVFFLIYSGFLFVKASGDVEAITKAKQTFNWTCFGIAVLLGAQTLSLIISGTISQLRTP